MTITIDKMEGRDKDIKQDKLDQTPERHPVNPNQERHFKPAIDRPAVHVAEAKPAFTFPPETKADAAALKAMDDDEPVVKPVKATPVDPNDKSPQAMIDGMAKAEQEAAKEEAAVAKAQKKADKHPGPHAPGYKSEHFGAA